jgi:PAP2 superfamily
VSHAFWGFNATCMVGIVALGVWCSFRPNNTLVIRVFLRSLIMPPVLLFVGFAISTGLNLVGHFCPLRYDLFLHAIDHTIGFCPSQVAARLINSRTLHRVVLEAYLMMPLMMIVGHGWAVIGNCASNRLLLAYTLTGSAPLLYMIVPAAGPGFILGSSLTSGHPPPQNIHPIVFNSVVNCIPSVHLSTSLVIWFFNRSNRKVSKYFLAFVLITAFATLALGEHYLIDLVMSFPFTLFIVSAVTHHFRRAAISILVVISWLLSIRLAIQHLVAHPILLWTAAATTVGASLAYLSGSEHSTGAEKAATRSLAQRGSCS